MLNLLILNQVQEIQDQHDKMQVFCRELLSALEKIDCLSSQLMLHGGDKEKVVEFVFPEIKAHCVTINGYHLIFSPGTSPPIHVSEAAFDLAQNCSGMTISESETWLRERHGGAFVRIAHYLAEIVDLGYFNEPQLSSDDCEASLAPATTFGICITHKCNMRCRYCFASDLRISDEPEDITLDTACVAIDFLFDVLQPPWVNISLGITGEPQLRWDLIKDVIEYGRKRSEESGIGARFHITTNGLYASPDMMDYLRSHDDIGVTLSWDGPPQIHNSQRLSPDGSDTYDKVSNTFEILKGAAQSRPLVTATVTTQNIDMAGVFTHLFDRGVRDLTLKPTRSVGPAIAITDESLLAFKTSYAEMAELLLQHDFSQVERLFTVAKDDSLGRYIYRIAQGHNFLYPCPGGRLGYDVDTNGDIYPCASLVGATDFRMGNVRTGFDERMSRFFLEDTSLPKIQACEDCWAKYYCGGPCTYVSALTCGRFDIPYEPNCELTKYLIELAGYVVAKLDTERPGLLAHVLALRSPVPIGPRREVTCHQAPQDMLSLPTEAWKSSNPIELASKEYIGGQKRWNGPLDCSASVHFRWDNQYLYVMAEVHDDKFVPPSSPDGEWWFRDSIQFALDPENDGGENRYPWKLPEGDYEYGVAWVDGETYVYDCQADPVRPSNNIKAIVTREDNVINYRVAVPWKQISGFTPSAGAECRLSVVVNDCDGGHRGWLQWTHGLATRKAPARFGTLRLVE